MTPTKQRVAEEKAEPHVQQAAFEGVRSLLTNSTTFLAWRGTTNRAASGVGTGVVLRTPNGTVFVLSAAHVLDEVMQWGGRVGWFGLHSALHLCGLVHRHPSLDVALLVPEGGLQHRLASVALDLHLISETSAAAEGDVHVLIGFPGETVELYEARNAQNFFSLTYAMQELPTYDSKGRLALGWAPRGTVVYPHPDEDRATTTAPEDPSGMSGGPLWRHRDVTEGVWDPRKACKIVGIETSWMPSTRTLYFEPVERWREWMVATLTEVERRR